VRRCGQAEDLKQVTKTFFLNLVIKKTSEKKVPLSTKRSVGDLQRRKLTAVQRR
jgi:hypothetical protein